MARHKDEAVEQPNPDSAVGKWDWHVWRKDHNGDEWIGFFADAQTALNWVKTQYGRVFEVNNVPPATSHRFQDRVVKGVVKPASKPRKVNTVDPFARRPRPVNIPVAITPMAKAKPVVKALDPEAAKLRKQAKDRLAKHHADEAADVAAGKIENV